MAEAQDVDTLKRRGRRRLVGAVALVLLAVIVLPMVPDPERVRAETALANAQYVIAVGAFTNADSVTSRLAEAKVPYYTEAVPTAKGTVTRVRAGPFATKAAADRALEKLKGLGFKPGN